MPILDNGPEPTEPKWGKIWLNDHGQQQLAEMESAGISHDSAMQQLCAAGAVETAIYAASRAPFDSVQDLEWHIATYCPPRTKVEILPDGIRINGRAVGYIKYPVHTALTKEAYAVLSTSLHTEDIAVSGRQELVEAAPAKAYYDGEVR